MSNPDAELLSWMTLNSVVIHPALDIKPSPVGGNGVFAKKKIKPETKLLSIHKDNILSPRTCGISNLLGENEFTELLSLALAVWFEYGLGDVSPWAPYLKYLMNCHSVILPQFWPPEDQELLKGSEPDRLDELSCEPYIQSFENRVKPFLKTNKQYINDMDFETFKTLISRVSSRAFDVDEYHGLSLVPGADFFNHSFEPDVAFETIEDVCNICGALACDHRPEESDDEYDQEDEDSELDGSDIEEDSDNWQDDVETESQGEEHDGSSESESESEFLDDLQVPSDEENEIHEAVIRDESVDDLECCDIAAINPIAKGQEIFNAFGEYGNETLLTRYGFAVWENPFTTVSLGTEFYRYACDQKRKGRLTWWDSVGYPLFADVLMREEKKLAQNDPEFDEEEFEEASKNNQVSWKDALRVNEAGEPTLIALATARLLILSEPAYLKTITTSSKKNKRLISKFLGPFGEKTKNAMKQIIKMRLSKYQDGDLSSSDYFSLLSNNQSQLSGNKRAAIITIGTEKLKLEQSLQFINEI